MTDRLHLQITALAARQIREAEAWWRSNRPAAPKRYDGTMNTTLLDEARRLRDWYNEQQSGLGTEFRETISDLFRRLAESA